jgi:hypothetical protein
MCFWLTKNNTESNFMCFWLTKNNTESNFMDFDSFG